MDSFTGTSLATRLDFHYENMPMQYTEIFLVLKIENFQLKFFYIFLIFTQNIDCECTLEPLAEVVLTSTNNLFFGRDVRLTSKLSLTSYTTNFILLLDDIMMF